MSDRIEPALSAEEWKEWGDPLLWSLRRVRQSHEFNVRLAIGVVYPPASALSMVGTTTFAPTDKGMRALLALANAALPDSDPRKITRRRLADLRALIDRADRIEDRSNIAGDTWQSGELTALVESVESLADALESYLPPSE